MAGPSLSSVRFPVVAGRFYPADGQQCRQEAQQYLHSAPADTEKPWLGAMIPHAGWICSAAVAGQGIASVAARGKPDVVIVFGAVHSPYPIQYGALDSHGAWRLPTGDAQLAEDLQRKLLTRGNLFLVDGRMHEREHSIEVCVPMIQLAFPGVPIVPIEAPVLEVAELIGRRRPRRWPRRG